MSAGAAERVRAVRVPLASRQLQGAGGRRGALLAVLAAATLAACSKATTTQPGPDAGGSGCDVTPCALASGVATTGAIEAVAQNSLYTIELPVSASGRRTLLKVALTNAAPVSPVRLMFFLETPDGLTNLATRGPAAGTGAQQLAGNFLLSGPGLYRLRVRDSQASHVDAKNPYTLTATLLDDPDAAEPDDLPAQARPLAPAAAGQPQAQASGIIASAGDRDLLAFDLAAPSLVRLTVQQAAVPAGPLRLRYRLLQRLAATPDDLGSATAVIDGQATAAGAAVAVDQIRFLAAGRYLVALEDVTGKESDERAAARWTAGLSLVPDPDPNEQTTRNDTAATATPLAPGESKEGAIGSAGDVDWFQVDLPATAVPQLLELRLDPQLANRGVQLNWAVGVALAAPAIPCDFRCPVSAFCAPAQADGGKLCAYTAHAVHHFAQGETAAQVVRLRHFGPAETVRIVLDDQNGDQRSTDPYKLSAALLPEPDVQESTAAVPTNDARGLATAALPTIDDGGVFRAGGAGQISWWDFLDGKTTAELAADVDWYELRLPPKTLAPNCPLPPDAGPPDAGDDAGPPNRLPDGGVCGPDPLDGGPVYLPRPDYGLAMRWKGPADGTYRIGFEGWAATGTAAGAGCFFAFDEKFARDGGGGTVQVGDAPYQAGDPCFCLDGKHADRDRVWVRVEAAHRPAPPAANAYTDQPYSFSLDFRPGPAGLAPACDGGCSTQTASSCF